MQIKNHFLYAEDGTQVKYVKSPNTDNRPMDHKLVCLHYTAGSTATGAATHFSNPNAKASAHLVVDRDGSIIQCVPFNKPAYHAGTSEWKDIKGSINKYSIGIEIVNFGKLTKAADGKYYSWTGKLIPSSDVVITKHPEVTGPPKPWHRYTEAQLQSVEDVCKLLIDVYKIEELVTHEMVCVPKGRKADTGPAFPLDGFVARLFGRHDE